MNIGMVCYASVGGSGVVATELGRAPDAIELMQVLGPEIVTPALLAHVDFQPAEATAAEAPGA